MNSYPKFKTALKYQTVNSDVDRWREQLAQIQIMVDTSRQAAPEGTNVETSSSKNLPGPAVSNDVVVETLYYGVSKDSSASISE